MYKVLLITLMGHEQSDSVRIYQSLLCQVMCISIYLIFL